ncbi:MAG: hydrogenase small subunit [Gammaproteobacteria bacterium]|nr:hydrogenase small subunit [Gammaproteobacteria bacterium]
MSLASRLGEAGISRRAFLKYCGMLAASLGLPTAAGRTLAEALDAAPRQSVIWLSFQECTGCTESLTRAHAPTLESLIFDHVSLDYHHTLQAAAGEAAERARHEAMERHAGEYLVLVDGSIPVRDGGVYSTIAGVTNLQMLQETARDAAALVAIGSCAAFGGLPMADPNPTGAAPVGDLVRGKPLINLPGCPPIPASITGVLAHYLAYGRLPELDHLGRPKAFFGESIHDRCYRRPFYDQGLFARGFDDEGARKGWCLYLLGCKGPTTHNACAVTKWNDGTSFPIEAGHPCLGCSEPRFWDAGGFYRALSAPTGEPAPVAVAGLAVGAVAGAAAGFRHRRTRAAANAARPTVELGRDATGNEEERS